MTALSMAEQLLLAPGDLQAQQLSDLLGSGLATTGDESDLYLQYQMSESWMLENGVVSRTDYTVDQGFGLRMLHGEQFGYAYGNDLHWPALQQAMQQATLLSQQPAATAVHVGQPLASAGLYPVVNPSMSLSDAEKVDMLQSIDHQVRAKDSRIKEVIVSLSSEYDVVYMLRSDGRLAADVRPQVSLRVQVIAQSGAVRGQGSAGGGARADYIFFQQDNAVSSYVDRAVHQALLSLEAKPAPAGEYPVVLGAGWPAVLFHEAVGHGLEADFNRKGTSIYSGRLGEQVASDKITLVDDGTLAGRRGSLNVDDEGTPTQCTTLIENGVLKQYMQDRLNARLMQMSPTGNGRRESYASPPLPRMTNTYILPGKDNLESMIASMDEGLYAVDFSGGQVDITAGTFVFSASEAYWVKNGKIAYPVKGATIIGNGPAVMQRISAVGSDFALDSGIGTCGKDGQSVPVGVGQPALKVDLMTIGGSGAA